MSVYDCSKRSMKFSLLRPDLIAPAYSLRPAVTRASARDTVNLAQKTAKGHC